MDAIRVIERLREHRVRPERNAAIAGMIDSIASHARRSSKKLCELVDLWERLVPAEIASRTVLTGLRAGVLHVRVDCSSTAYEVDRLLREGLEARLRAEYRGTLGRIRTRVGSLEEP